MMTVGLTKIRQGKTRSIELALYFVVFWMRQPSICHQKLGGCVAI